MLFIVSEQIPDKAAKTLHQYGNTYRFASMDGVYSQIASHPDIFMCQIDHTLLCAPWLPEDFYATLCKENISYQPGYERPGGLYPLTARYNAVYYENCFVHKLSITDPRILECLDIGCKTIDVKQGYTRCNLLPLSGQRWITSDRDIEQTLMATGMEVLFVDPKPIVLTGFSHGFFPGCCGITPERLFICGSLQWHPQGEEIRAFVVGSNISVVELYYGPLLDIGAIICC